MNESDLLDIINLSLDFLALKEDKNIPLSFLDYFLKDKRITQTAKAAWLAIYSKSRYYSDGMVPMSPKSLGIKIGVVNKHSQRVSDRA